MKVSDNVRKDRSKQTAEIFTPPQLVKDMLDKLPQEAWDEGKTILDPACGNGNFLVAVLWRKIKNNHNVSNALSTVYGCDIMKDNIVECRLRLLKIVSIFQKVTEQDVRTVLTNIHYLYTGQYPKGSLDYDYGFDHKISSSEVAEYLQMIADGKLDCVDLPYAE